MLPVGWHDQFGAAGSATISSELTCVVDNSSTGEVIHIHRITNIEGARNPSNEEIEGRALDLAVRIDERRDRSVLATMFVSPKELASGAHFKIDLARKKLVHASSIPTSRS
jgi:hypothetical protein